MEGVVGVSGAGKSMKEGGGGSKGISVLGAPKVNVKNRVEEQMGVF